VGVGFHVELSRLPDWVLKKYIEWASEKIKEEEAKRRG
jgi:hypothetical protein